MARLRWKLNPRQTGLAGVAAGPRGSYLHDGETKYATVSYVLRRGSCGWYWVSGWGSGVPYKNTCNEPCKTQDEAKAAAFLYVCQHLNECGE